MEIIDVITFNGEFELLKLRLSILSPYVDKFIVVEFDKTFSGNDKPTFGIMPPLDEFLETWKGKVDWYYHTEKTYGKYRELAEKSPNTQGADHWKTEFMMKESIKDCLLDRKDNDIIYIGDVDEIWEPFPMSNKIQQSEVFKLKLKVYTYYLNNKSSEEFWGPIVCRYKDVKDKCLNHIRSTYHNKTTTEWGWHFTSMGGYEKVKEKLTASYTDASYATPEVLTNLKYNVENRKDFLGRKFVYLLDESEWPQYLKEHKAEYSQLCL